MSKRFRYGTQHSFIFDIHGMALGWCSDDDSTLGIQWFFRQQRVWPWFHRYETMYVVGRKIIDYTRFAVFSATSVPLFTWWIIAWNHSFKMQFCKLYSHILQHNPNLHMMSKKRRGWWAYWWATISSKPFRKQAMKDGYLLHGRKRFSIYLPFYDGLHMYIMWFCKMK